MPKSERFRNPLCCFLPLLIFLLLATATWTLSDKPERFQWGIVFSGIAAVLICCLRYIKTLRWQYGCLGLLSLFLALALGEYTLGWQATTSAYAPFAESSHAGEPGMRPCESNIGPDPVLGYAPRCEAVRTGCFRRAGTETIYDVVYGFDRDGRRVTPDRGVAADAAILFFGCSFTFGEGLNDRETYPYRVAELLGQRYQVFNFALSGYGAHQALALLESGRLDRTLGRYRTIQAFFLSLEDHARRCGGYAPWDRLGPHYLLDAKGVARHEGNFRDAQPFLARLADDVLAKSQIYARLFQHPGPDAQERVNALHVALLARMRHILREKYHATLVVLTWPQGRQFMEGLRGAGLPLFDLGPYLPGFTADPGRYAIPGDGHPNALANACIAKAVAGYIATHP